VIDISGRMRPDNRDPVYTVEQVDQMILTPEARSTLIIKKKPKYEKVPIYSKDKDDEKIPLMDEKGNMIVDQDGALRYLIKDYEYVQRGWEPSMEVVPASELFTIDLSTSNISADAVKLLTSLMWNYNHILSLHDTTDDDYSSLLHKIRNDIVAIVSSAKSYHGGAVSAVKTYRSVTDNKQWQTLADGNQGNKSANPLAEMLGGLGKPKKKEESPETKYTAFT